METIEKSTDLTTVYQNVRQLSQSICKPLLTEDYVVQPVVDVSPPKWHLGHTTWFFEHFLLADWPGYKKFDPDYDFVFNSYYESVGKRVVRTDRGNLSRPAVSDVYRYRNYVDEAMHSKLSAGLGPDELAIFNLGINHEQQHQELLLSDIKYILGHNPLLPAYDRDFTPEMRRLTKVSGRVEMPAGVYEIGFKGGGFCFDNELGPHRVFLERYSLDSNLVTNAEFAQFIDSGGYRDFRHWHAEGWDWVRNQNIDAPMYWHFVDGQWHQYTLAGLQPLDPDAPVCHVSYYEASAYAAWKGKRLPTEFEWEAAADKFEWGVRWEWTCSAYSPYPGFRVAPGALGEYNGKFMVNQMVLRGASVATSPGHSRPTYRNFFHPNLRWQFTGIRLAD